MEHYQPNELQGFYKSVQALFQLIKKKHAAVHQQQFETAAHYREAEKQQLVEVGKLLRLKTQKQTITLLVHPDEHVEERSSLHIQTVEQFSCYINYFGLPGKVKFQKYPNQLTLQSSKLALKCVRLLVLYCMENDVELPTLQLPASDDHEWSRILILLARFKK